MLQGQQRCISVLSSSGASKFINKKLLLVDTTPLLLLYRLIHHSSGTTASPAHEHATIKHKVAMWIGYVGTSYRGLQIHRASTINTQTIEEVLEKAIFKAGAIKATNFGSLGKVRWMRSSRTDKGVHSLSTVITFKMEIELAVWSQDDYGIAVAEKINQHLPKDVQIFGFVRVNKSFEPRKSCCSRTYNYLLPERVLNISDTSQAEDVEGCIHEFQKILSSFEGRHPFHNYTVRSRYRKKPKNLWTSKGDGVEEETEPVVVEEDDDDIADMKLDCEEQTSDFERWGFPSSSAAFDNKSGVDSSSQVKAKWLFKCDSADMLSKSHYRRIFFFHCGLQTLEGIRFVKLSIQGESFMLHQIRKMVGTAIAIMKGVLPSDVVPISLARPCRMVLPLAPSEGLVLASNEFYPFRSDFKLTGAKEPENLLRLTMPNKVAARRELFWLRVLLPNMISQLQDTNSRWNDWLGMTELCRIPEAEMEATRMAWRDWKSYVHEEQRESGKTE